MKMQAHWSYQCCRVVQSVKSIKLLSVLFVLEDTLGVQGKEPFFFPPTTCQLSDASTIVLEIW